MYKCCCCGKRTGEIGAGKRVFGASTAAEGGEGGGKRGGRGEEEARAVAFRKVAFIRLMSRLEAFFCVFHGVEGHLYVNI